jgi:carbon storage regulator
MLILARRVNECIVIGDDIKVSVVDIRGDQVKLGIDAPRSVKVYRQEVYDAIQAENREAAISSATDLTSLDSYLKKKKDSSPE